MTLPRPKCPSCGNRFTIYPGFPGKQDSCPGCKVRAEAEAEARRTLYVKMDGMMIKLVRREETR